MSQTFAELSRMASTGSYTGGLLSVGSLPTQIVVSAGEAQVADPWHPTDPTPKKLSWPETTIDATAILATIGSGAVYVGVKPGVSGTEFDVRATPFAASDLAMAAPLGRIGVIGAALTTPVQEQTSTLAIGNQLATFMRGINSIAIEGVDFVPVDGGNGARLSFEHTPGRGMRLGLDFAGNPFSPNERDIPGGAPAVMRYLARTAPGVWTTITPTGANVIDPTLWDDNGVLSPVPNSRWTLQMVYYSLPSDLVFVQYGQRLFDDARDAMDCAMCGDWEPHPVISLDLSRRAFIAMRGNLTRWSQDSRYRLMRLNRFGALGYR